MTLDVATEVLSRRIAQRVTRRSLLGRAGAALAVAGAGIAVEAPVAVASCGCGCSTCDGYSTSCGAGSCPSGTCSCGSWYLCTCSSRLKRYQDCCSSSCSCYCGSDGRVGCYFTHEYGSCASKIKCRALACTNMVC